MNTESTVYVGFDYAGYGWVIYGVFPSKAAADRWKAERDDPELPCRGRTVVATIFRSNDS